MQLGRVLLGKLRAQVPNAWPADARRVELVQLDRLRNVTSVTSPTSASVTYVAYPSSWSSTTTSEERRSVKLRRRSTRCEEIPIPLVFDSGTGRTSAYVMRPTGVSGGSASTIWVTVVTRLSNSSAGRLQSSTSRIAAGPPEAPSGSSSEAREDATATRVTRMRGAQSWQARRRRGFAGGVSTTSTLSSHLPPLSSLLLLPQPSDCGPVAPAPGSIAPDPLTAATHIRLSSDRGASRAAPL